MAKVLAASLAHSAGFEAVQHSAALMLADLYESYLRELAVLAHELSNITGRTQPSLNDVEHAFKQLDVNLGELYEFLQSCKAQQVWQLSMASRPPVSQHLKQAEEYKHSNSMLGEEDDLVLPPDYVPFHLPPFPARHSFIFTPPEPMTNLTPAQKQKMKCDQRRQVEIGLYKLMLSSNSTITVSSR